MMQEDDDQPTEYRTQEIAEHIKEMSRSLKEEAEDAPPKQQQELAQLAHVLHIVSASSTKGYGLSLFSMMSDMLLSRDLMMVLRERDENGELPMSLDEMIGYEDDDEDDNDNM